MASASRMLPWSTSVWTVNAVHVPSVNATYDLLFERTTRLLITGGNFKCLRFC